MANRVEMSFDETANALISMADDLHDKCWCKIRIAYNDELATLKDYWEGTTYNLLVKALNNIGSKLQTYFEDLFGGTCVDLYATIKTYADIEDYGSLPVYNVIKPDNLEEIQTAGDATSIVFEVEEVEEIQERVNNYINDAADELEDIKENYISLFKKSWLGSNASRTVSQLTSLLAKINGSVKELARNIKAAITQQGASVKAIESYDTTINKIADASLKIENGISSRVEEFTSNVEEKADKMKTNWENMISSATDLLKGINFDDD